MTPDLALALAMADDADAITMLHFRSAALSVRTKDDRTPVSAADEAVERMIRQRLAAERPDDGIVGEEFGAGGASERRWIIDPIDATKNYIRGIPVFATLIGFENGGRLAAGVVSAPALGRRWWAARGEGAFCNGEQIRVSQIATIGEAQMLFDGLDERLLALARRSARTRGFGDFWQHMLVAEGAAEIAIDPVVAPWDMAAVQIIVEEAGGRFTNLRGEPRHDGGSGLSTNGLVHDEVLRELR